ncbi:hypothetical protein GF391_00790 [Candidatus Uhrbacteria bacterium]|nr:hypothetical protein [Candidatus Uhrbacteria bacterium]
MAGAARMPGGTPVGSARRLVHKLKILGVGSWWVNPASRERRGRRPRIKFNREMIQAVVIWMAFDTDRTARPRFTTTTATSRC